MENEYRRQRGFTLIELLVVIAIIGILSAVVLASLSTARVKARDASRKAEVGEFEKALELYYANHGNYPCGSICGNSGVTNFTGSSVPGAALISDGAISSIPADPTYTGGCNSTAEGYCYCSLGSDSYVLTVHLETSGGTSQSCYIRVGPNASTFCGGHQYPGTWAYDDCSTRF